MPAKLPEHLKTVIWEHEDGDKSIRINYDASSYAIKGFNLFGIRYRHEVCEKWITENTHVETVLENLGLANFDPEFYAEYETELIKKYNQIEGKQVKLKTKRGLSKVLSYLKKSRA